jgi:aspartate/methionine/tyrosine aminotransferase
LNPGDEILVPDPSWLNYTHVPTMIDAVPVPYTLRQESGFQMDIDELEALVTPRTKMIAVLNPSNPTGAVQSYETLKAVAEFAVKHDLVVISDEIYEKILYDGQKHYSLASFPGMWERTILLNGFAKSFAMTGWRLGYVAAPLPLINVMNRLHMYIVTHSSSMVQYAGAAALNGPQDSVNAMVKEFTRRRDYMLEAMKSMPRISCVKPGGAFYLFPSIEETGMSCEDFTTYLLRECGVAVVPGTVFGAAGKGHVRISYATSYENIVTACAGMKTALLKLAAK